MTTTPTGGPVIRVKAQENVYTLLLLVAILVLGATIGIVLYNLTTAYGLSFGDLFKAQEIPG